MAEMIEQLAARAFQARNVIHRAHLNPKGPKSGFHHEVLGALYEDLIEAIDAVVEVYQGRYGITLIPKIEDKLDVQNIGTYVLNEAVWIEANRDKFAKSQAVLNRIDDLAAVYLRANFKLTNLL
jgi:hypothetical protein